MMVFLTPSAGLLDTRVALNLSQFVGEETDYVPCVTALSHLASVGSRLILTPVYGLFQVCVCVSMDDSSRYSAPG